MQSTLIFWPMIALALATMSLYVRLSSRRVKGVKEGTVKGSVYKLNVGEPEESLQINRAIVNQFESPVLFYVVCLAAYVSQNANGAMLALAWIYTLGKLVHMYVHTTSNAIRLRRRVFMVTYLVLMAMWLLLAGLLIVR